MWYKLNATLSQYYQAVSAGYENAPDGRVPCGATIVSRRYDGETGEGVVIWWRTV